MIDSLNTNNTGTFFLLSALFCWCKYYNSLNWIRMEMLKGLLNECIQSLHFNIIWLQHNHLMRINTLAYTCRYLTKIWKTQTSNLSWHKICLITPWYIFVVKLSWVSYWIHWLAITIWQLTSKGIICYNIMFCREDLHPGIYKNVALTLSLHPHSPLQ